MQYFEANRWYNQKLAEHRELISFMGELSEEIITDKMEEIEDISEKIDDRKISRVVYFAAVELMQNLFHHAKKMDGGDVGQVDVTPHFFLWQKNKNGNYIITTGNYVTRAAADYIKARIDQLNELGEAEIRALSKVILYDNEFSERGGAGLGMIELIRKTGNKLRYKFYDFNENYVFFEVEAVILT